MSAQGCSSARRGPGMALALFAGVDALAVDDETATEIPEALPIKSRA